jgi:hypothetical protein
VAGPLILIDRNSASPAASDAIGRLDFRGRDSVGNVQNYALLRAFITSPTDTSEAGTLQIDTVQGGTVAGRWAIGAGLYVGDGIFTDPGAGKVNASGYSISGTDLFAGARTISAAWTFSTAPVISTITNTGTLTLPTSTDTLVGRATTDTLTNKTINGGTLSGTFSGTPTFSGAVTFSTAPIMTQINSGSTLTLPTSTDTLVGRATDTLTNKTLTSPTISGDIKTSGSAPSVSSCGTSPSMASGSSDLAGAVTVGSGGPTSCLVTWAASKTSAPFCTVSTNSAVVIVSSGPTTTTLAMAWTGGSPVTLYYICIQH